MFRDYRTASIIILNYWLAAIKQFGENHTFMNQNAYPCMNSIQRHSTDERAVQDSLTPTGKNCKKPVFSQAHYNKLLLNSILSNLNHANPKQPFTGSQLDNKAERKNKFGILKVCDRVGVGRSRDGQTSPKNDGFGLRPCAGELGGVGVADQANSGIAIGLDSLRVLFVGKTNNKPQVVFRGLGNPLKQSYLLGIVQYTNRCKETS